MIPENKWKWIGLAAHFICGQWCRFHLATEIGAYLISTVGDYHHPAHDPDSIPTTIDGKLWWPKSEQLTQQNGPIPLHYIYKEMGADIGCDRKYETMVFSTKGRKRCPCGCGMKVPSSFTEIDFSGYNDLDQATKGHLAMCRKYARKQPGPR